MSRAADNVISINLDSIGSMPTPAVIDTIRAMHAHGRTLHGYCWRCQR